MPRPTRIQYENAYYHVMNRGKARQTIFHGEVYYQAFLQTLDEAHKRFDACIHAYCLMGNHYHLLIETPRANGAIVRDIPVGGTNLPGHELFIPPSTFSVFDSFRASG